MTKCFLCNKKRERGYWCTEHHEMKAEQRQELNKMLKEKGMTFSDYLRDQMKKDGLVGKSIFKTPAPKHKNRMNMTTS